jgi:hypothetical protein
MMNPPVGGAYCTEEKLKVPRGVMLVPKLEGVVILNDITHPVLEVLLQLYPVPLNEVSNTLTKR